MSRKTKWTCALALSGLGLVGLSSNTAGQDDALLRAAYCVGVLEESIRGMSPMGDVDMCTTEWSLSRFKGDMAECKRQFAEVRQAFTGDYEQKRKRYAQYVALRTTQLPENQRHAVLVVVAKGAKDAAEKQRSSADSNLAKCAAAGDQLPECVEKYDQVFANIIRCQYSPDRLPF